MPSFNGYTSFSSIAGRPSPLFNSTTLIFSFIQNTSWIIIMKSIFCFNHIHDFSCNIESTEKFTKSTCYQEKNSVWKTFTRESARVHVACARKTFFASSYSVSSHGMLITLLSSPKPILELASETFDPFIPSSKFGLKFAPKFCPFREHFLEVLATIFFFKQSPGVLIIIAAEKKGEFPQTFWVKFLIFSENFKMMELNFEPNAACSLQVFQQTCAKI